MQRALTTLDNVLHFSFEDIGNNNFVQKWNNIRFFAHPIVWAKDKYSTGLNRSSSFVIAILPASLGIFALIANVFSVFGFEKIHTEPIFIISTFLFVYGLINVFLVSINQRHSIRLSRHEETFEVLHKSLIEQFRDYHAKKKHDMTENDIKEFIHSVLKEFNSKFMHRIHRKHVSAAIKYQYKDHLYVIRDCHCSNRDGRHMEPEPLKSASIYQALNDFGVKQRFIYIKDIHNMDNYEYAAIGKRHTDVKSRAGDNYSTFIALPIRSGVLVESPVNTRTDFGLLGFDLETPYGFGNLYEHEVNILGCFADLLSEPVEDLIDSLKPTKNNLGNPN